MPLDLSKMRPPVPGEAPPMTVTDHGWVCRKGLFAVRQKERDGHFEFTMDGDGVTTLIGLAPASTPSHYLRNQLSMLERARLITDQDPTIARLGPVSARRTIAPNGKHWVDVWVDKGRGRNHYLLARISVPKAATPGEALRMLRPWADRIVAEDARLAELFGEELTRADPKPIVVLQKVDLTWLM
jgi:hypothetical protein